MEQNRKTWNDQHKQLRKALEKESDQKIATNFFLVQHAMVHSAKMSKTQIFSFEDEILNGIPVESYRQIPPMSNHSIAWIIWHLARVEDVTMNLLVADAPQILLKNRWLEKLEIHEIHTGNGMSNEEVRNLSKDINIRYLREYRLAVGRETRKIVKKLKPAHYKIKVDPLRLQRIWDEQAMLPKGKGIVDYWGNRTISGLLLMPPTRHCFLHLNEARRIKSKIT